jgi:hypothetical protein
MRLAKVSSIALAVASVLVVGRAQGSVVLISYLNQNRSVSANSSATDVPRGGTSSMPITDQQSESQQASGLGVFTGMAAASSTIGLQSATSSASQTSTLGDNGFSASGSVIADSVLGSGGPANSSSSSVFDITFSVAQTELFTFDASLDSPGDPGNPTAGLASITLTKKAGKNVFTPITSVNVSDMEISGTFKPGTYSLMLDVMTSSGDENKDFVNYDISLTDSVIATSTGSTQGSGGSDGTTTSPVPLPSSWIMSLVMLLALGAADWVRRQRRAWTPM